MKNKYTFTIKHAVVKFNSSMVLCDSILNGHFQKLETTAKHAKQSKTKLEYLIETTETMVQRRSILKLYTIYSGFTPRRMFFNPVTIYTLFVKIVRVNFFYIFRFTLNCVKLSLPIPLMSKL